MRVLQPPKSQHLTWLRVPVGEWGVSRSEVRIPPSTHRQSHRGPWWPNRPEHRPLESGPPDRRRGLGLARSGSDRQTCPGTASQAEGAATGNPGGSATVPGILQAPPGQPRRRPGRLRPCRSLLLSPRGSRPPSRPIGRIQFGGHAFLEGHAPRAESKGLGSPVAAPGSGAGRA